MNVIFIHGASQPVRHSYRFCRGHRDDLKSHSNAASKMQQLRAEEKCRGSRGKVQKHEQTNGTYIILYKVYTTEGIPEAI